MFSIRKKADFQLHFIAPRQSVASGPLIPNTRDQQGMIRAEECRFDFQQHVVLLLNVISIRTVFLESSPFFSFTIRKGWFLWCPAGQRCFAERKPHVVFFLPKNGLYFMENGKKNFTQIFRLQIQLFWTKNIYKKATRSAEFRPSNRLFLCLSENATDGISSVGTCVWAFAYRTCRFSFVLRIEV